MHYHDHHVYISYYCYCGRDNCYLQSTTNLSTTPSQLLQTYTVIPLIYVLPSLYTSIPLSIVVVIMIVTTTNTSNLQLQVIQLYNANYLF
jgi:hypothetical protein